MGRPVICDKCGKDLTDEWYNVLCEECHGHATPGRRRAIENGVSNCPNCGGPSLDGGDGWILCGGDCTLRADRKTWEALAGKVGR